MGLNDVDNEVKKPVTQADQCTDDAAVSKDDVDGAVEVPPTVKKSVLTSIKQMLKKSKSVLTSWYSLGCAAVSKIDKCVRDDEVKQKMKKYLPGPEGREKIVQALSHPATQGALNLIVPGAAEAANYLVESVRMVKNLSQNDTSIDEQNKYEDVTQQLKVLQAENEKMQEQLNKLVMTSNNSSTVVSEEKPEEVITEFMTTLSLKKMQEQLNKLVMTSNNSSTVSEEKPEEQKPAEEVITEFMTTLSLKKMQEQLNKLVITSNNSSTVSEEKPEAPKRS